MVLPLPELSAPLVSQQLRRPGQSVVNAMQDKACSGSRQSLVPGHITALLCIGILLCAALECQGGRTGPATYSLVVNEYEHSLTRNRVVAMVLCLYKLDLDFTATSNTMLQTGDCA